ncbi:FxsA family protein [Paracoccaceae bacterium Fryx2]|nr:FxsA family protein [Paracoccaceae bacterium Fryx2]
MWLFAFVVGLPLIEISLFVTLGGWLTLWPTLALVLASAVLGVWILRGQGLRAVGEMRNAAQGMADPLSPLAQGALRMMAGIFLVMPGFFTSAVGLLLLVPQVRDLAIARMARRMQASGVVVRRTQSDAPIDADYQVLDATPLDAPDQERPGSSGWTRH